MDWPSGHETIHQICLKIFTLILIPFFFYRKHLQLLPYLRYLTSPRLILFWDITSQNVHLYVLLNCLYQLFWLNSVIAQWLKYFVWELQIMSSNPPEDFVHIYWIKVLKIKFVFQNCPFFRQFDLSTSYPLCCLS